MELKSAQHYYKDRVTYQGILQKPILIASHLEDILKKHNIFCQQIFFLLVSLVFTAPAAAT